MTATDCNAPHYLIRVARGSDSEVRKSPSDSLMVTQTLQMTAQTLPMTASNDRLNSWKDCINAFASNDCLNCPNDCPNSMSSPSSSDTDGLFQRIFWKCVCACVFVALLDTMKRKWRPWKGACSDPSESMRVVWAISHPCPSVTYGRTASGGAWAPEPPLTTRVQPRSILYLFSSPFFSFFSFFLLFSALPQLDLRAHSEFCVVGGGGPRVFCGFLLVSTSSWASSTWPFEKKRVGPVQQKNREGQWLSKKNKMTSCAGSAHFSKKSSRYISRSTNDTIKIERKIFKGCMLVLTCHNIGEQCELWVTPVTY